MQWTTSAPSGSNADALEKARSALRQKMSDLNAQQGIAAPPSATEPVALPMSITVSPATSGAVAEAGPAEPAPANAREAAIQSAVAEARARQKTDAKIRNEEFPGKPIEASVETPGVLTPLFPPPMPLNSSKEQRLRELLYRYSHDQISPEQYHQQRTKILAEP